MHACIWNLNFYMLCQTFKTLNPKTISNPKGRMWWSIRSYQYKLQEIPLCFFFRFLFHSLKNLQHHEAHSLPSLRSLLVLDGMRFWIMWQAMVWEGMPSMAIITLPKQNQAKKILCHHWVRFVREALLSGIHSANVCEDVFLKSFWVVARFSWLCW
jgi:hypothetical protein